jgi:hypothetical protein
VHDPLPPDTAVAVVWAVAPVEPVVLTPLTLEIALDVALDTSPELAPPTPEGETPRSITT